MKRIQARFKKYSHAKRFVDINFLSGIPRTQKTDNQKCGAG